MWSRFETVELPGAAKALRLHEDAGSIGSDVRVAQHLPRGAGGERVAAIMFARTGLPAYQGLRA